MFDFLLGYDPGTYRVEFTMVTALAYEAAKQALADGDKIPMEVLAIELGGATAVYVVGDGTADILVPIVADGCLELVITNVEVLK